jgi:import inner membrane translocase subunit TIM21
MLLPCVSKMSPNRVFDRTFEAVRNNPEVKTRFGDSLKAYGRDHGGHREGRRNFVEHTQYKDEHGDDRTRVRFNLEGRFGKAFVFAEVSKSMPAGEFVYGMCIFTYLQYRDDDGYAHPLLCSKSWCKTNRTAVSLQ